MSVQRKNTKAKSNSFLIKQRKKRLQILTLLVRSEAVFHETYDVIAKSNILSIRHKRAYVRALKKMGVLANILRG